MRKLRHRVMKSFVQVTLLGSDGAKIQIPGVWLQSVAPNDHLGSQVHPIPGHLCVSCANQKVLAPWREKCLMPFGYIRTCIRQGARRSILTGNTLCVKEDAPSQHLSATHLTTSSLPHHWLASGLSLRHALTRTLALDGPSVGNAPPAGISGTPDITLQHPHPPALYPPSP